VSQTRVAAPPRRSRRDQLALIAAELFAQKGFHNVSVNDIAAAAGVSGPAIYRHFTSKQAILAHVVCGGLDETADIIERRLGDSAAADGTPSEQRLKAVYAELAAFVVRRPEFGVLWRREGRYLSAEELVSVTRSVARGTVPLVRELDRSRPGLTAEDAELLSWAALSVLGSISDHRVRLPQAALERLLTAIALDVLAVDVPAARPPSSPTQPPAAEPPVLDTRRKQLLAVAARLFRERGYHAVTIENIGAAAGIAGPSIYSHVGGKMELLQAAANRIGERLGDAVAQVRAADLPPRGALDLSAGYYVDIVIGHRDLVAAYFREGHNLPDLDRAEVRRWQRAYTEFWADLVGTAAPGQSPKETRIRVHAAFAVVNDTAQTGRFMARPHLADELRALMLSVLTPVRGEE
jgi:AcrR family transcriptional regulator